MHFLSKQFDVNKVSHKSKLHEYVRNVMVHLCKECNEYFFISFSLSLLIITFDHFNYEALKNHMLVSCIIQSKSLSKKGLQI